MRHRAGIFAFITGFTLAAFGQVANLPQFEVASVKQEAPGPNIGTGFVRPLGGGRLTAEKALLRVLIREAFRVRATTRSLMVRTGSIRLVITSRRKRPIMQALLN
jgi:hypothetical protein